MVRFCFRHWDKLQSLISRCWAIERVEEFVERAQKSRIQILQEAKECACVCKGRWLGMARELFSKNGLDEEAWCKAVLFSLANGRSKGHLVCHAGHTGNEGTIGSALSALAGRAAIFSAVAMAMPRLPQVAFRRRWAHHVT